MGCVSSTIYLSFFLLLKAPRCYRMMSSLKICSGFCNFFVRVTMEVRSYFAYFTDRSVPVELLLDVSGGIENPL